ncbi:MAG: hypothetical protein JXB38_08935 [Anaerolineales bacterium]|nr:hypothetical protein [Anaerolineales bacterium]
MPKREPLSEREKRILDFIRSTYLKTGREPSLSEIQQATGIQSLALIDYYRQKLEERGLFARKPDGRLVFPDHPESNLPAAKASLSSIRALGSVASTNAVIPLLGRIVASAPIPMPSSDFNYFDPESSIEVPYQWIASRSSKQEPDLYALEVSGDSMVDALVGDGDIVVLKTTSQARNGEMVAVWLEDFEETTLKYWYREGDRLRLQPANPLMSPIFVERPEQAHVMGSVQLIIRDPYSAADVSYNYPNHNAREDFLPPFSASSYAPENESLQPPAAECSFTLIPSRETNLSIAMLSETVLPYLSTLEGLQNLLDDYAGRPPVTVHIRAITQHSPISVDASAITQAVELVGKTVSPRKRELQKITEQLGVRTSKLEIAEKQGDLQLQQVQLRKEDAQAEEAFWKAQQAKFDYVSGAVSEILGLLEKLETPFPNEDILTQEKKAAYRRRLMEQLDVLFDNDLTLSINSP